jgi:hypothetical protein
MCKTEQYPDAGTCLKSGEGVPCPKKETLDVFKIEYQI